MRFTFVRRGTLRYDAMPNMEPESIARLSDSDLYRLISESDSKSMRYVTAQADLRRRESQTARLALWVAFGSLLVSFAGLLVSLVH